MKIPFVVRSMLLSAYIVFLPCAAGAISDVYEYQKGVSVIGSVTNYRTEENESLIELARKVDIGYNSITDANPLLDPFDADPDVQVVIPSAWILPDVESYNGIVINISELRLYYFTRQGNLRLVRIFPVGIGREEHDTPPGKYSVIQKIVNPAWHVPRSIREEKPELPDVVPPGPDNPLGTHALRLSTGDILIHGTNKPWGVGRKVSHGCIRLYPEDIIRLFPMVLAGTRVTIVRQPVKVGLRENRIYLEVHNDELDSDSDYLAIAQELLRKKGLLNNIDTEKLSLAVHERLGMPVDISE